MKNRSEKKTVLLVICLISAAVLLILLFGLINDSNNKAESLINDTDSDLLMNDLYADDNEEQIFYQNEWYVLNEHLETYLMIGIDQMLEGDTGRQDSHQSDFLALIIMDRQNESFQVLHLNRDTMTEIPMVDIAGVEYGTTYAQLALSHGYGSNDKARCRNSVKAVENLLYGVEIDHYISITMDAVAILNDSIGGVTVQLLDDFTDLDPSFTEGTVVTLTGGQALQYVRARSSLEDSSNLSRMERQRQYINALFDTYVQAEQDQNENSIETLLKINEYMVSDCTINQLDSLTEKLKEYTYEGILTLEGEAVQGDEYMEYYLDEEAAQAAVIELFYTVYEGEE